jgi:hypothetical protein
MIEASSVVGTKPFTESGARLRTRAVRLPLVLGALLMLPISAYADNSACWGDNSRGDISCVRITERLLLSFRGQTEPFISKTMNAPGRTTDNGLHYMSNYDQGEKGGTGDVNVTFEDGKATSVFASVDTPDGGHHDFIWSAYAAPTLGDEIDRSTRDYKREAFCSDLSGKPEECSAGGSMEDELTQMQMQGNLSKADLLTALDAACNPGQGLTVSDPNGDCDRLREMLQ